MRHCMNQALFRRWNPDAGTPARNGEVSTKIAIVRRVARLAPGMPALQGALRAS